MENNIESLLLKKEEGGVESTPTISDIKDNQEFVFRKYLTSEEYESIKQIVPPFIIALTELFDEISKLIADAIKCFNNSFLTTKSLADMFPANNKLKIQGKPMRRIRAYAKNDKNKRRVNKHE